MSNKTTINQAAIVEFTDYTGTEYSSLRDEDGIDKLKVEYNLGELQAFLSQLPAGGIGLPYTVDVSTMVDVSFVKEEGTEIEPTYYHYTEASIQIESSGRVRPCLEILAYSKYDDEDNVRATLWLEEDQLNVEPEKKPEAVKETGLVTVGLDADTFQQMQTAFDCYTGNDNKYQFFFDATPYGDDEEETELTAILGQEIANSCIGSYCLFYLE